LFDNKTVARCFAFEPQLVAGAAIEGGESGLHRLLERFLIHETDHEDAARRIVLNDGRNEAAELAEVQIVVHSNKKARLELGGLACFSSKSGHTPARHREW
jgi:hypothetical protein